MTIATLIKRRNWWWCGLTVLLCGCASPLVDMRRTYNVYMDGLGDNTVTVPVDVKHQNQIEAKLADRLTGVQGAEISGNTASAGIEKGAVKASLK